MINYSKLPTERRNKNSESLDLLPVDSIIELMNRENRLIPDAIEKEKRNIGRAIQEIVKTLRSGGRIFFVGAGTSGRLGTIECAELPPTFNTPPQMAQAIMAGGKKAVFRSEEGSEDDGAKARRAIRSKIKKGDIVIGIAASAVTPFVQAALAASGQLKAKTVLVTCNHLPSARGKAEIVIALNVGPEMIAGSTRLKAGTVTKMVLNILTTASMVQLGKVFGNRMVDLQPKSKKLRERGIRLVQELAGLSRRNAQKLLAKSGWNVKTAILMSKKTISRSEAIKVLKANGGFLRKALSH